ncbi:hypothetical protein FGE12_08765 [Aggregicoccus sp. 17bor-14]|uniref:hypothetical protein n=1 Tax=Myxococcaceae TaxID=31 RepID=UPI00129C596D|nr:MULTISPECIES: hypothetical protein [Myxococcaceae]MBF5042491.1 hypothetical protein [Simulacricoccus sp. 17bor-14]MRI88261.1 hypothetical protein [Aggregicoccus sp. 17bor-14]
MNAYWILAFLGFLFPAMGQPRESLEALGFSRGTNSDDGSSFVSSKRVSHEGVGDVALIAFGERGRIVALVIDPLKATSVLLREIRAAPRCKELDPLTYSCQVQGVGLMGVKACGRVLVLFKGERLEADSQAAQACKLGARGGIAIE